MGDGLEAGVVEGEYGCDCFDGNVDEYEGVVEEREYK